jgi:hypothetical protein
MALMNLLEALRAAGCNVFVDEGQIYVSPPSRPVAWDDDVEEARCITPSSWHRGKTSE